MFAHFLNPNTSTYVSHIAAISALLQVYKILLKATACVQPVSCDEAYLDVTGLGSVEDIAAGIRQQIEDATGCTASAGIGPNMLIARLATKEGKPNGQYRIAADQARHLNYDVTMLSISRMCECHPARSLAQALSHVNKLETACVLFIQSCHSPSKTCWYLFGHASWCTSLLISFIHVAVPKAAPIACPHAAHCMALVVSLNAEGIDLDMFL